MEATLENLLCVIHRDGGHYIAEHGLQKAFDDALKIHYQQRDAKEYVIGKKLFTKIKYAVKIIFGTLRCSGYGVYPNGIKCIGCSDCKKAK